MKPAYEATLPDLLQATLDAISRTMEITDIVINGDGTYTITVCDLKWAEPGRFVSIADVTYKIEAIDDSVNTMLLSGSEDIAASTFDLYQVHFFIESIISLESKAEKIDDATEKTPMLFLPVNYRERNNTDNETVIAREADCTLYFLTQANFPQWLTDDFYANAIRPMNRMRQLFIQQLKKERKNYYMDDVSFNSNPVKNFGVYVNGKGVVQSWMTDNLSGYQMDFAPLQIMRTAQVCECKPMTITRGGGGGY